MGALLFYPSATPSSSSDRPRRRLFDRILLSTAKVFSRRTILKQFAMSASFMQVEQVPLPAEAV